MLRALLVAVFLAASAVGASAADKYVKAIEAEPLCPLAAWEKYWTALSVSAWAESLRAIEHCPDMVVGEPLLLVGGRKTINVRFEDGSGGPKTLVEVRHKSGVVYWVHDTDIAPAN